MFGHIIDLDGFSCDDEVFDYLYCFFDEDFVKQRTMLADVIYLDPKGQGVRNGREEVFWHITTRDSHIRVREGNRFVNKKTRPLDPDRACRMEWIRTIVTNHTHAEIKLFYRKETKGKKPVRLYLWAYNYDFVVIVQKLGASDAFLVTSFYITESYKRASYEKWYSEYHAGSKPELSGCEWF